MGFVEVEVINDDVLDVRMYVRCLNLRLENNMLELNCKARRMVCFRAIQSHLTHCIVRTRLAVSPRREDTLRSVNLFYEICHSVNMVMNKILCLSHGMLIVRLLVLIF